MLLLLWVWLGLKGLLLIWWWWWLLLLLLVSKQELLELSMILLLALLPLEGPELVQDFTAN